MNIKNIISLFPIYYDILNETAIIVAVLDLRQNPKNIENFISKR